MMLERVMLREAAGATVVAAALAIATAVAIRVTATEAITAVTPLVATGVILHWIFLIVGSVRWVGVASAPMAAAIVLEAGFADEPSWIRSILIGCLWYVTMEASWEAIHRRRVVRVVRIRPWGASSFPSFPGRRSLYTREANERRVHEVVTVVALSLALSLAAMAATVVAPVRSVFLQALVLGGLLAAFVALVRAAVNP